MLWWMNGSRLFSKRLTKIPSLDLSGNITSRGRWNWKWWMEMREIERWRSETAEGERRMLRWWDKKLSNNEGRENVESKWVWESAADMSREEQQVMWCNVSLPSRVVGRPVAGSSPTTTLGNEYIYIHICSHFKFHGVLSYKDHTFVSVDGSLPSQGFCFLFVAIDLVW